MEDEAKEITTDSLKSESEKIIDDALDGLGKESGAPSDDTSAEKKPEGEEPKDTETPTAEVDKTEKVKEVEADTSLSVEDKIAKIKEISFDKVANQTTKNARELFRI